MTKTLPPGKFCAAAHSNSDIVPPSTRSEDVLLIGLISTDRLEIRVRPDWQSQVRPQSRKYLSSFFADIARLAAEDPIVAFEQICSLSVGPIVTSATGDDIGDRPDLLQLWETFVLASGT